MNPLSDSDLERVLRHAPIPPPPPDLLAELERQLDAHLPAATPANPAPELMPSAAPRAHPPRRLFRLWLPVTGLAGLVAAAVVCALFWLGPGTSGAFAESFLALSRVKSFRVVERTRLGPGQTILKDPKIDPHTWPNYVTSQHPANPLVETVHWFRTDPDHPGSGFTHTVAPDHDAWRSGNVELTIDHGSGQRRLRLTTGDNLFASLAPVPAADDDGSREVHPPGVPADTLVYEKRYRISDEHVILRLWVDRASRLPRRLQFLSPDFPAYGAEVLLHEYEFLDYDADFPSETFAFAVTDADLAPLGLTRTDWEKLDRGAVSFQLDGEPGLEIRGTFKDEAGARAVSGHLPFVIVHTPRGKLSFQLEAADGKRHALSLRFNSTSIGTTARRLIGELSDGSASVQGRN